MVCPPEKNMMWPLPKHEVLRHVPVRTELTVHQPAASKEEIPNLTEIEIKAMYYQPGEVRLDMEDWCREVARLHFTLHPADRIPFRRLTEDNYWRALYRQRLKPQAAYDQSPLSANTTPLTKGVLKDKTVTCAKTVVRS